MFIDVVIAAIAIGIVTFTFIPEQQELTMHGKTWLGTVMRDMRDGLFKKHLMNMDWGSDQAA